MKMSRNLINGVAVLYVSALLFSCGSRNGDVSTVSPSQEPAVAATALDGAALLKQGYTRISDDAYVLDDPNGSINFVTSGKSGSAQALNYLREAQGKAETNLNVLSTQSVSKQALDDAQHRLRSVKGMIDSLNGAELAPASTSDSATGSAPTPSGILRPLAVSCSLGNTTTNTGGTRGQYAFANADVNAIPGNFNTSACYSAKWQIDVAYPRTGNTTIVYGNGSCSSNPCYTRGSGTGYPSGGSCFSFAYVNLQSSAFDPGTSRSSRFDC